MKDYTHSQNLGERSNMVSNEIIWDSATEIKNTLEKLIYHIEMQNRILQKILEVLCARWKQQPPFFTFLFKQNFKTKRGEKALRLIDGQKGNENNENKTLPNNQKTPKKAGGVDENGFR